MHKRTEQYRFTIICYEDDTVDVGDTTEELINGTADNIDDTYTEIYKEFYNSLEDLSSGVYEHTLDADAGLDLLVIVHN